MKTILLIVSFILISYIGFAQATNIITISEDVELIKLSDDVYLHISYCNTKKYGRVGSNGLIIIDGNEAFIIDTPWGDKMTKELYVWITDSMDLKVSGFIPTHWHADCMGGLGFLQCQGVESYANQMTIDIAKSKELPVPSIAFTDSLKLNLGDKQICCYYLGAAHTLDNIVVWIPSEYILFAGCMLKDVHWNNLGNTADGDLKAYPKTIDRVLKKFPDVKVVIPGHGNYGGKELITHTKDLLSKN